MTANAIADTYENAAVNNFDFSEFDRTTLFNLLISNVFRKNGFEKHELKTLMKCKSAVVKIDREDMAMIKTLNYEKNRALSLPNVAMYVRILQSQGWVVGESAFVFTKEGQLINGNTRTNSLLKSEVESAEVLLRWDADISEYPHMDGGRKRSDSDALGVPKPLTEVANFIIQTGSASNATKLEKKAMCDKVLPYYGAVATYTAKPGYEKSRVGPGSLAALAYHANEAKCNEEELNYIYSRWEAIVTSEGTNPDPLIEKAIADLKRVTKGVQAARMQMCVAVWYALSPKSKGKARRPGDDKFFENQAKSGLKEFYKKVFE